MYIKFWAIVALFCFLSACTGDNSSSSTENSIINEHPSIDLKGMVPLMSTGLLVDLGSQNKNAKANERPQMTVKFDYDFWFGEHEVTCGEVDELANREWGFFASCKSDSEKKIPITDVTYYDAVIFANAKSRSEHMDTVYRYSAAMFDKDGHCVGIDGLSLQTNVKGYRLPTEAEWVLVASRFWDAPESWNSENSDYRAHEVCSKRLSSSPFCDLAGNVMEWVNDWLGSFKDTTLSNYMGAPNGGALGERVVKGGSFRISSSAMNSFSRGDVYTVTSSTRANYVGFRLAYGEIQNAKWLSSSGQLAVSQKTLLANSSLIRSLTGTFKTKLAFRDDVSGNLAFVDYTNGLMTINEIADTIDVYHPDISPDGKKVAFCTGLEGISGNSSVYVRNLDATGSDLVKLDVESAAIPRWRVLENGDTIIVYVTNAGDNSDSSSWMSQSTWQVSFANGSFGKPKKMMDGAYHGGVSLDGKLAVTGSRLLRARVAKGDAFVYSNDAKNFVWYGGEQACNASLANDGSNRTLFLDFSGEIGNDFVGEKYGVHERLLIADASGNLVQSVKAPAGSSFDHTEWALNDSNLIVATTANVNGAHEKIVAIDLRQNKIFELVKGDEVWHPCLWVNKRLPVETKNLDSDSAGAYMTSFAGEAAIILRYKVDLLWNLKDSANVIVLGSSRPLNAIIPLNFDKSFFCVNMSNVPNTMAVSQFLFENYVLPHVENLKFLIISLDIDMWWKSDFNGDNFFYEEYKNYPGFVYDENHNFWKDGYPEGLAEYARNGLGLDFYSTNFIESRGYNDQMRAPSYVTLGWEDAPMVEHDSTWMKTDSGKFEIAFNHLKNIIAMAQNRGVRVIGVVFPQSPNFKKTGSFGRYGLRRSETPAVLERIEKLKEVYSNFIFVDENKMGDHDYTNDMAENKDHLAYSGAVLFTSRLNSLLLDLEGSEK